MPHLINFKRLFPLAAFLLFGSIAVMVWQNQNSHQRELVLRHAETTAEQIRIRIKGFMMARMASIEILAQRWVERRPPDFSHQRFLQFASAFHAHYAGFKGINWIDPQGTIQWVYPEEENSNAKGKVVSRHSDLGYREIFEKAGRDLLRTMTPCVELFQGGLGFEIFWPLIHEDKIQGYLSGVFQIDLIMDICLAENIRNDFRVCIYEDNRLIYTNGNLGIKTPAKNKLAASRTIHFSDKTWQLDLEPRADLYTPKGLRNLPLLIFDLSVATALAFLLHLLFERIRMYRVERDRALREVISRKQTEEALLETEKRFRDLVENSLTGISIIQDNRVVYQNPEQERLLGPLPRSPKFTDIENIHSEDIEKIESFYSKITSGDFGNLETDFGFYPKGGTEDNHEMKWVHCMASSIEYQGREAILINMMDITRTKELEHLLRISDKMTSLGRVAAGIAHEIRNPLSGINIYLNTLAKIYNRGDDLEKINGIIRQMQSASNKIESIIKRVMDFSKPGKPKLVLTDINGPIEEAVSLSSVTLRKRGIEIENILDVNLPRCQVDYQLIEQVILNLLTNAAESMKNLDGRKKIEVVTSRKGANIIVSVSDTGPGVPEELADKVFDPFYTTKDGSTGIGLSLCHRIVSDHGGSLTLFKSKWGGAKFTIEIPIEKGTKQR